MTGWPKRLRMEIRAYQDSDRDRVARLWREVFPDAPPWNDPIEDIGRKMKVQRGLFIVALSESEIIGTAMGGYDGHRGWVHLLAVSARHRTKGVGRALMRDVEARLAQIGCPKLNLQVRAENEVVVEFYRKLGYVIEPRVSMSKRLAAQPQTTPTRER